MVFDATASVPRLGEIEAYEWDFGDGCTGTGPTPTHIYGDNGSYTVTLRVRNTFGYNDTDTCTVTVANVAPLAAIGPLAAPTPLLANDIVTLTGHFTDPGFLDTHTISWDFGDGTTATEHPLVAHAHPAAGRYTVTFTVIDDDGGIGSAAIQVVVNTPLEALCNTPLSGRLIAPHLLDEIVSARPRDRHPSDCVCAIRRVTRYR